jgi:hypothetical protein
LIDIPAHSMAGMVRHHPLVSYVVLHFTYEELYFGIWVPFVAILFLKK